MSTIATPMELAAQPLKQSCPLEWLLVYSIELNGGLDDAWLEQSGISRQKAEILLRASPEFRGEARYLQGLGRVLSLGQMFELLRQKAMEMLARATKPAELRSLLGTLQGLAKGSAKRGSASDADAAADNADIAALRALPEAERQAAVATLRSDSEAKLAAAGLPRQQRRKLERMLAKLEKAGL